MGDKPVEHLKENDIKLIKTIIQDVLREYAQIDGKNTNPGAVILENQPPYQIYQKAVKSIFQIHEIKTLLAQLKSEIISYKNARGLIGATAATAWHPTLGSTYELITYREKTNWGAPRSINAESVKQIDIYFPSTFDNYDYRHAHNRIAPNSPCPILYGIRGETPSDLPKAMKIVESEPTESWMIFQTNQGSDDHLQTMMISEVAPYHSVIITGTVSKNPYTIIGGHVIFSITDTTGEIDVAAYEPTKEFRSYIRQLTIGDIVIVYGGVRKTPATVNLEKIKIQKLVSLSKKIENPVCKICGKHMKSAGKHHGFRCRKCGTTEKNPVFEKIARTINIGWYETPVCARRHLSKPLKLMNKIN